MIATALPGFSTVRFGGPFFLKSIQFLCAKNTCTISLNLLSGLRVLQLTAEQMETDDHDRDLLARIAKRDSAALRALYMSHNVRVYRFVLRLAGNENLAEDVVSETFLKVWQKAASYTGQAKVTTWLLTIARNEAISVLRRKKEAPLDAEQAEAQEDESDTQEIATAKKDKGAIMRACIDKLSEAHREVIDLVYYQELAIFEIAEMLDIPENTVKTRMFHARKQLSEHFRRAGIDRGWP